MLLPELPMVFSVMAFHKAPVALNTQSAVILVHHPRQQGRNIRKNATITLPDMINKCQ